MRREPYRGRACTAATSSNTRVLWTNMKPLLVTLGRAHAPQLLLCSAGVAVFAWACSEPRFRDAEGFLAGTFCLPVAVALALLILGWGVTGRFRGFACWCAVGLVGQAVALQMINAGPLIHYQHYRPVGLLLSEAPPLLLLYVAAQSVLVVAGLTSRWRMIRAWIGPRFKVWQLAGPALLLALPSAAPSLDPMAYVAELVFATSLQAINLGTVALLALALPEDGLVDLGRRFRRVFGRPGARDGGEPGGVDRF